MNFYLLESQQFFGFSDSVVDSRSALVAVVFFVLLIFV